MRLLEKAHIPQLIGEEYITVRVNDAVLLCKASSSTPPYTKGIPTQILSVDSSVHLAPIHHRLLDQLQSRSFPSCTQNPVFLSIPLAVCLAVRSLGWYASTEGLRGSRGQPHALQFGQQRSSMSDEFPSSAILAGRLHLFLQQA